MTVQDREEYQMFCWKVVQTAYDDESEQWSKSVTEVRANWVEVSESGALIFWKFLDDEPFAVAARAFPANDWDDLGLVL